MAAAPQVQTLAQVMADLNPAYAGQQAVISKQQAAVPVKYDAQRAGLTAAKGQGFNAINNQATGRGGSFSGIPIDEQATYLSTKYLPGLQAADAAQNADQLTLEGQAAALESDKTKTAMGTIDRQKSDLNSWNLQQMQLEATARENALNRAATAAENAKSRAASAPKTVSPDTAALSIISQATGKDGFVSPSTFQLARDYYVQAGGKASDFASKYWKYTGTNKGQPNQSNWKSYYYG